MASDSQKRASRKYTDRLRSEGKLKTFRLDFYEGDLDLYEYVKAQPNTSGFIRSLIRKHMESN